MITSLREVNCSGVSSRFVYIYAAAALSKGGLAERGTTSSHTRDAYENVDYGHCRGIQGWHTARVTEYAMEECALPLVVA